MNYNVHCTYIGMHISVFFKFYLRCFQNYSKLCLASFTLPSPSFLRLQYIIQISKMLCTRLTTTSFAACLKMISLFLMFLK